VVSRGSAPAILRAAVSKAASTALEALGSTARAVGRDSSSGRRRGAATVRGSTVPVSLRLVHALAHSDALEATCLKLLNHVGSQVQSCQLMNVVSNGKTIAGCRLNAGQSIPEVVLRGLDLLLGELVVV
jgi:hypothetical protein